MGNHEFRGKCISTGEWVYGSLIKFDETTCFIFKGVEGANTRSFANLLSSGMVMVESETVGKRVKDFYEGDILKIECFFSLRKEVLTGVIEFDETIFMYGCSDWALYELLENVNEGKQSFEIVGNVHDNPEMINEL